MTKGDSEENVLLNDPDGTNKRSIRTKSNSTDTASGEQLMGSMLRRKKIVSLPIGDRTFFGTTTTRLLHDIEDYCHNTGVTARRATGRGFNAVQSPHRNRQLSLTQRIIRRKQVSLDMFSVQETDFFLNDDQEEEKVIQDIALLPPGEEQEGGEVVAVVKEEEKEKLKKLFLPLRFPPHVSAQGKKNQQQHSVAVDNEQGKEELIKIKEEEDLNIEQEREEGSDVIKSPHLHDIVKATHTDKIRTLILFCIMSIFLAVCVGWKTHQDESHMIFGTVGLACVTPCYGSIDRHNFFTGHHNKFHSGDVISLLAHIDPKPEEEYESRYMYVDIIRLDDNANGEEKVETIVHTETFGPLDSTEDRETKKSKVIVDWIDSKTHDHIIHVSSSSASSVPISFTLAATRETSLSKQSVLVAALIMVFVYIFILLELIHRTLVSIYGSMVALFFFFLMHGGETESIKTVMLHQEWSTLGLLFGMMILVGELSHTGIFEWLSVRLLVSSKGSFQRLLALLSLLTAVASAFLDNVTTMLLLAPVTIDMCNILKVDPRPYLIAEVILSNIGGTATLIGDPPNIIIGSSFDEVGFVDFIINIMPCIMLIAVPISLVLMLWIYNPYLTMKKMPELDAEQLKNAYPIYDEPRLYIAGTATSFVILLFFLHPIHHKDTAWIALIGAFLTITFTNPHDVQDALRNHVEWDTLLFFAGLFVLVEVCAAMGLLEAIGGVLANVIKAQDESQQLTIAITLILWVSAITSAFLDNIPYTATMIPVVKILHEELPDTLPIKTLAWALSFGACLGGNGTLLGASANIVTIGIASNKGYNITFLNFFYPGFMAMIVTTVIANIYMLVVYVWV